jgi:hypothetical protein
MHTMRNGRVILLLSAVAAFAASPGPASIAAPAAAQPSRQAKIERAMKAAPAAVSHDATIVDVDGTVLRTGTNGWHCHPGVMPGDDHPMCNDEVWMQLMAALSKKADFKPDRVGISYMLQGDAKVNNADPFDTTPDPGEVWVQEGPHLMIIVPDAAALEGLPTDPDNGGPYVMWKGTPYAHIMIPVGPRPKKK